jgi:predicted Zn-dependent peptidase
MKRGSRLHKSLVRERQIATDASSFTFDLTQGADLLVADVTARPEVTPRQLEKEVDAQIAALLDDGVKEGELERAIALIETDMIAAMQSASERADRLSMFATYFRNPELLNEQAERYRSVTVEQVNAFVREHLIEENRASLLFVPAVKTDASVKSEAVGQ